MSYPKTGDRVWETCSISQSWTKRNRRRDAPAVQAKPDRFKAVGLHLPFPEITLLGGGKGARSGITNFAINVVFKLREIVDEHRHELLGLRIIGCTISPC